MQQTQQREIPERISWARAMVFAVGFFFIAALLVGQIPSYIYTEMTSSSLVGFEQGSLALALTGLGGFAVIQVIVLLFDPKPLVPPIIFTGLGAILSIAGLALVLWAVLTGNQYFPSNTTSILPLLGGNFLWFQPGNIDFVMIGAVILGVGLAMVFYSILALREQVNPDRRDLGTTPVIRWLIIVGAILLAAFLIFYTYINDQGLAVQLAGNLPAKQQLARAAQIQVYIDLIINSILSIAIFCVLAAFALRLHYLMRPVRKSTMSRLYIVGALGFAQIGALMILVWIFAYPLVYWLHSWTFLGLGDYLTLCSRKTAIPASCVFAPQAGYIIDAIISTNSFALLMAAVWAWKTKRNLVVVGGLTTAAILAIATLLVHLHPGYGTGTNESLIAMLLGGGALVLVAVWTSSARREFAVVGENNLGCLGMWLVVGTCLFIYLAGFAFFSIPGFNETEPNVPFTPGLSIPPPVPAGQPPVIGAADAVTMFILMAIIAGIQFYFLRRNRYRV